MKRVHVYSVDPSSKPLQFILACWISASGYRSKMSMYLMPSHFIMVWC